MRPVEATTIGLFNPTETFIMFASCRMLYNLLEMHYNVKGFYPILDSYSDICKFIYTYMTLTPVVDVSDLLTKSFSRNTLLRYYNSELVGKSTFNVADNDWTQFITDVGNYGYLRNKNALKINRYVTMLNACKTYLMTTKYRLNIDTNKRLYVVDGKMGIALLPSVSIEFVQEDII